jgi:hypothetical protein
LPGPRERGIDVVNLEIDDDPGVRAVGTAWPIPPVGWPLSSPTSA